MGSFFNALGTGLADLVTFGGYSKQKQMEKQEELNNLQMQREDSAYERTVKDMRNAGLSTMAMSGTNAAQPLINPIDSVGNNAFDKAMTIASTISSVATGLAQAKNLNAGTVGQMLNNQEMQGNLDYYKKLGKSSVEVGQMNAINLAKENKGFWGRFGSDLYDTAGGKINDLVKQGAEVVQNAVDDLAKGKDSQIANLVKDTVKSAKNEALDTASEKSKVVETAKKYKDKKKDAYLVANNDAMKYWQSEIDRLSKGAKDPSTLNELSKARAKYEEAKKRAIEDYKKHWSEY